MSEALFAGMAKSRTPEEFVKSFILPGLSQRQLPPAEKIAGLIGEGNVPNNFLEALKPGEYRSIIFTDEKDHSRTCSFRIGWTQTYNPKRDPRKTEAPIPAVTLFLGGSRFQLDRGDYQRAAKQAGEISIVHSKVSRTVSRVLMIPRELVNHDEWVKKTLAKGAPNSVHIALESEVFDKLSAHNEVEDFLRRYLHTISFVSREIDGEHYLRKLGMTPNKGLTAYQTFHQFYSHRKPFMQALFSVTAKSGIKKIIKSQLDAAEGLAEEYSNILGKMLTHPDNRKAANKIKKDSQVEPEKIWQDRIPFESTIGARREAKRKET